ncbi:hypothetical protein K0M31_013752 [Melipona bicolor]|uniref:Uncharacterized protein n=1 Tax=Melipona bicolor TaxID=60889 RepID=A0AA40FH64_9HYME|nr:hypothetical protein K0M31_013752 [Melipona bicolor]
MNRKDRILKAQNDKNWILATKRRALHCAKFKTSEDEEKKKKKKKHDPLEILLKLVKLDFGGVKRLCFSVPEHWFSPVNGGRRRIANERTRSTSLCPVTDCSLSSHDPPQGIGNTLH